MVYASVLDRPLKYGKYISCLFMTSGIKNSGPVHTKTRWRPFVWYSDNQAFRHSNGIQKQDHLASPVFKWHSKTGPFGIQPLFNHLNTKLVWYSGPHCISEPIKKSRNPNYWLFWHSGHRVQSGHQMVHYQYWKKVRHSDLRSKLGKKGCILLTWGLSVLISKFLSICMTMFVNCPVRE